MRILALLLLTCTALHADVLADLKNTLAKLDGHDPVKALVTREYFNRTGEDDKPVVEECTVSAQVSDNPDGLTITWPRALIDAAAAEMHAKEEGSSKKQPTRRAMEGLSATTLSNSLNFSPNLRRMLEQSELLAEKAETWEGKPARLLTLKVNPKLPKYVKELDQTLKLWLDADGLPRAAEMHTRVKGRAFLVVGFQSTQSDTWQFSAVDRRLIVTRHSKDSQSSGAGENGAQKTTTTLSLATPG